MDHTNWLEIGTTKETKGNMLRYSKARKAFVFRSEKGQIQGSEHCMTTYPVKTGRFFFGGGGGVVMYSDILYNKGKSTICWHAFTNTESVPNLRS